MKYLLYYLAWRIAIILITTYIFPETWFRNFIQSYRRYLIILSTSYFIYCYYIDEEEKKYLYLRNALLYFNIYLALHVFFRPLLNIEPALFLLLACILLLLRYISQLHIKYKRPFYLIGGIISFLILISGLFYLYPNAPDINGFINQQSTQLITTSSTNLPKQTAYINLIDTTTQRSQDFLFQTGTQFFSLPTASKISYISTSPDNEAQLFILFSDASLIQIQPQSTLAREKNQIFSEIWTITSFSSLFLTWTSDKNSPWEEKNSETDESLYEQITFFYWTKLKSYLTEQMGSLFLASPTVQEIHKTVLKFLSKTFPGFFSQNLKNYYQFEYYFSLFTSPETLLNTNKYLISNTIDENPNSPNLFQQLKNNIQLSRPSLNNF